MRPRPLSATALAAALVALSLGASPLAARAEERTITVTGAAQVEAVPDLATVQAGVETRGDAAADALAANSTAMQAVFAALEEAGIAKRDMQTSQLSLNPVYDGSADGSAPRLVAYEASNMVTVRVRDVPALGAIIDSLAEAGSNRLYGISFDVADPLPQLDEARGKAVADARHRAELYASAAGVTLGAVQSISERVDMPSPIMLRAEAAMDSPAPVAEGTVSVSAQVSVVYAIE